MKFICAGTAPGVRSGWVFVGFVDRKVEVSD